MRNQADVLDGSVVGKDCAFGFRDGNGWQCGAPVDGELNREEAGRICGG